MFTKKRNRKTMDVQDVLDVLHGNKPAEEHTDLFDQVTEDGEFIQESEQEADSLDVGQVLDVLEGKQDAVEASPFDLDAEEQYQQMEQYATSAILTALDRVGFEETVQEITINLATNGFPYGRLTLMGDGTQVTYALLVTPEGDRYLLSTHHPLVKHYQTRLGL